MKKTKKITKKKVGKFVSEKNLIHQSVTFPVVSFKLKADLETSDFSEGFHEFDAPINISMGWKLLGLRKDNRGIRLGCKVGLDSKLYEIEVIIHAVMEFNDDFSEDQCFETSFFQVLAAKLFFPYLSELISSNTARLSDSIRPLILEKSLLNDIINQTSKQKPFSRE